MRAVLVWILLWSPFVIAQADPSSLLIYSDDSGNYSKQRTQESGRYKVIQVAPAQTPKEKITPKENTPTTNTKTPETISEATTPVPITPEVPVEEVTPITPSLRDLLNEQDIRRNIFEVAIAPLYFYNHSSGGGFSYRDYHNSNLGFDLNTKIWLTPAFGLQAGLMKSLSSSIRNSYSTDATAKASHQWYTAGLRFRQFFGLSRTLPFVTVGVDYNEYKLQVPADDTGRMRQATHGLNFNLEGEFPMSTSYSWIVGTNLIPNASHREENTGIQVKSGTGVDTSVMELYLGGNFTFSRKSRMFWRLREVFYRHQFSGSASAADPKSGQTPQGVSVNNNFSIVEIGYLIGF